MKILSPLVPAVLCVTSDSIVQAGSSYERWRKTMTPLFKSILTLLFLGLFTAQYAAAQEGPCTDTDLPTETEDEDTEDDEQKEEDDVEKEDEDDLDEMYPGFELPDWVPDPADVFDCDQPGAADLAPYWCPWENPEDDTESEQSSAETGNQEDRHDEEYLTDLDIAFLFLLDSGHSEEEAVWVLEVISPPQDNAIAIPAFIGY